MKTSMKNLAHAILRTVIAASLFGYGVYGCSSSEEKSAESAQLEQSGENAESLNTANESSLNNDQNEAFANNFNEGGEGTAENPTQPASNEEMANLVEEGGEDASANQATADTVNPGEDPFAAQAGEAAPVNPFAVDAGTEGESAEAEETPEAPAVAAVPTGSAGVPETGSKMVYYVQPGDTLASISQKVFGDKSQWQVLAQENKLTDANKIYVGDAIFYTLNEKSKGFADKYESATKASHVVAKGETLSQIASKVYGSEQAWRTLWKENAHLVNPDRLSVGMTLTYRASEAASTATLKAKDELELEIVKNDDDELDDSLDELTDEVSSDELQAEVDSFSEMQVYVTAALELH